ncbi:uncharacterized protein LOC113228781 [Hyposmocoma kahamanoa]|uniref:uncharacterized protein LOC113228781 n=1 Tax=Hyposmocoma kahamanoa TaxID=1477025 RepID=UPI000E6D84D7|nr:uncharacterized protein LOC113228781 [Hyposmocoma kahamanoa]
MPCLKIMTNLSKNKIPVDFVEKIIPILAKSVRKPEEKFVCIISGDNPIHMFGDSKSPGAVATLESIGNLGTDENKIIIQALSVFIKKELGIVPERFFLTFYDLEKYNVGVSGTTVDTFE